jgi:hypothetical protein
MPCYRCGARQVDPDRGESPWKRGVRADRQVLVCPACQSTFDWMGELDHCPVCSSVHLVRRLGEVECRDCGDVRDPGAVVAGVPDVTSAAAAGAAGAEAVPGGAGTGPEPGFGETPGLAEEVELALERVLGRGGRPARIG